MASIRKRVSEDGKISFNVMIRKKDLTISKTFYSEEDAKLFEYFKERLIQNMENFDVSIEARITLRQSFELKIKSLPISSDTRTRLHFDSSLERISRFLDQDKFLSEYSYDDWVKCAKEVAKIEVFRGTKSEKNKRVMSKNTLRNIFSYASSALSYVQSQGIPIENHAMKLVKAFIEPMKTAQED